MSPRHLTKPSGRSPSVKGQKSRISVISTSQAIEPMAIVVPAWSRLKANVCWRHPASARLQTAWWSRRRRSGPRRRAAWSSKCWPPTCRHRRRARTGSRVSGHGQANSALPVANGCPRNSTGCTQSRTKIETAEPAFTTSPTRPLPSIWTLVSLAISVFALAGQRRARHGRSRPSRGARFRHP